MGEYCHDSRLRSRNVVALEKDAAFVGTQHAGDDFDGGGFSGAVGTEEANDFPGSHAEADVLNGGDGAKASVEMLNLEHVSASEL